MIKKLLPLFLLLFVFTTACKDEEGGKNAVDFDERAMLDNYGKNLIFPAYASLNQKTELLQTKVNAFVQLPTEASLTEAQNALKDAWLAWQHVSMFEFGPAATLGLRKNIAHFPTRSTKINNAIAAGSWDLNSLYAYEMKGFAALDYLLFPGLADQTNVVGRYTTDVNSTNWKQYLQAVTNDLQAKTAAVHQQWKPDGGNYLGTFITNTGNTASSSTSLLVNQLIQGFEVIKNRKIREPLGLLSIDGQPAPRNVEAYFSGYSLPLLTASVQAVENIIEGNFASGEGLGLADYLQAHYKAGNTQTDLAAELRAQLQEIKTAVNAIPEPLQQAVVNNKALVNAAYDEMVFLMPLLKGDLPSTLSIKVEDYGDIDGD